MKQKIRKLNIKYLIYNNIIEVKIDNHHIKPLSEVRSAFRVCLKGVFAKNEMGYRLNAIKKRL